MVKINTASFGDDGEVYKLDVLAFVCNNLISRVVQNHPNRNEIELYNYYCSQLPTMPRIDFRYNDAIWSADFKNVTTLTKQYPKSIHLKTAGWAAFHSSMTDYNRTALFFRASKYGSNIHNNADQLCFTMVHKGQQMFIASGYYDWYMSPHNANWRKRTKAQSGAITMDGGIGQGFNMMEASGNITQYATTDSYDYVTGDSLLAYNAGLASDSPLRLTRAIRSLVYLRGTNQFLIFDRFDAVSPRMFEWSFHAYYNFTQVSPSIINSTKNGVSTCINMLHAPSDFSFWQTDQFPPDALINMPNQAHGQFKMNTNVTSASFVVLIDPDCTGNVPQLSQNNDEWLFSVNGANFVFNGDTLSIILPPSVTSPDGSNPSPTNGPSVSVANSGRTFSFILLALVACTIAAM